MMTANEIRTKFLEFFKSKGHTIVASDSVVPKDDPTVLFTTAGMQQFKRQFLGHIDGYTRAATSQKCLRTDDLDKVGKTPCHHTFFEMLGNFSFGDYFKKDAIAWAWEFLTKEMKLSGDKLWVSVYKDDDEAYNEWVKMGFPKEKIVKLGDKDNFWPAEAKEKGPNGPCGPCSEIFFDYGVNPNCKSAKCDPSCSCGRFTEVWNLVFTQFNRKDGGILEPLPGKNIDTGMGLERLVAVVQGKKSNYETDLFVPIINALEIATEGLELSRSDKNVIVDHIRAIIFAINDGVIPSNKERGSVVKRLINDSTDIILSKGVLEPTIYKLAAPTIQLMKNPYPELTARANDISLLIQKTEEAFLRVRQQRIPELKFQIKALRGDGAGVEREPFVNELGKLFFLYRDTHGLPLSTILSTTKEVIAPQEYHNVDDAVVIFNDLMKNQQDRSRASSKMTGERFADIDLELAGTPKTKFLGYEKMAGQGKILKLFLDDKEVDQVSAGEHIKVILDQTPFYAESGGQIGDTGYLIGKQGKIRVLDTKKQDDIFIHFGKVESGEFNIDETLEARIDTERRLSIMRNHTATHLLQSALRETLGTHVQQQGSLVAEDRLRFDFTHPKAVTKEQLAQIEEKINSYIAHSDKIIKEEMTLDEAKKKGALAFFAEKYKDRVRVITIGNYSKEFCGGTHLDSTSEIKKFIISSEGAVAQGIRRLEAKTGSGAEQFIKERTQKEIENKQAEEKRQQELNAKKAADQQQVQQFKVNLKTMIDEADIINNTKILTYTFTNSDTNQLKYFYDLTKQQIPSVAVCFGSTANESASLVIGISDDLVKKGVKANELIKDIAPLINGSGGGRPDLAQAGSKEPGKLKAAVEQAFKIIKGKLK